MGASHNSLLLLSFFLKINDVRTFSRNRLHSRREVHLGTLAHTHSKKQDKQEDLELDHTSAGARANCGHTTFFRLSGHTHKHTRTQPGTRVDTLRS